MSRRGNCYDDAVMESFFSTVKSELADRFDTYGDAKMALFDYIEVFYNQRPRPSTLGQISPAIKAANGTETRGINDRGDIVGWFVDSGGVRHGYLLSKGQFTFIDCPGSTSTDTDGLNEEGDIVGGCVDADGHHAYVATR